MYLTFHVFHYLLFIVSLFVFHVIPCKGSNSNSKIEVKEIGFIQLYFIKVIFKSFKFKRFWKYSHSLYSYRLLNVDKLCS